MSKAKHTKGQLTIHGHGTESNPSCVIHAIRSHDPLVAALEAWRLFDSESSDKHPCPDLMLRGKYRDQARKLTDVALAEAGKKE